MNHSDSCPACHAQEHNVRPDVAYLTALILVGQNRLEEEIRNLCPGHTTAMALGAAAVNEAGDV